MTNSAWNVHILLPKTTTALNKCIDVLLALPEVKQLTMRLAGLVDLDLIKRKFREQEQKLPTFNS
jgi:hypothetical protein